MATAMDSRQKGSTPPWRWFDVRQSERVLAVSLQEDHLGQIGVRSDIRMGGPNVPRPRDLTRIQYRSAETNLEEWEANGHFWWTMAMKRWDIFSIPGYLVENNCRMQTNENCKVCVKWDYTEKVTYQHPPSYPSRLSLPILLSHYIYEKILKKRTYLLVEKWLYGFLIFD